MKNYSLRKKILIITVIYFIFFIALVIQSLTTLHKNIESSLEKEVELVSDVFSDNVGNWLKDRQNSVSKLAKSISEFADIPPYLFWGKCIGMTLQ